ncbi:SDR family NAD(P)-dependent oxidoreductase [Curtobacterium sp. 9128]|uniref:SDR family NAD(P)-dependent oxidoreductase n=1 Tax=Curtobacterium sp. 9128 TaxID=1793722 RepID=UPI0011A8CF5B|nr:SDR family NAD(P)-dependent oxidoreductase [Curtobacterium sp. 9128]
MSALTGRVALVTGAGLGIGQAVATGLADRGAHVAVVDVDRDAASATADMITMFGGRAIAVVADIADEAAVQDAVRRTIEEFGRLDIAINNAGVASTGVDLTEMPADAWERVLRINLTGTFFCLKHEIPALARAGGGAIVNVVSGGGLFAIPAAPAYVASKHGVVGLTKVAAVDFARHGVRVNAVAPSMTRTRMFDHVAGSRDAPDIGDASVPLGRLATPEEVAAAVIWLASDEASYVTGTTLSVDGGRRA